MKVCFSTPATDVPVRKRQGVGCFWFVTGIWLRIPPSISFHGGVSLQIAVPNPNFPCLNGNDPLPNSHIPALNGNVSLPKGNDSLPKGNFLPVGGAICRSEGHHFSSQRQIAVRKSCSFPLGREMFLFRREMCSLGTEIWGFRTAIFPFGRENCCPGTETWSVGTEMLSLLTAHCSF